MLGFSFLSSKVSGEQTLPVELSPKASSLSEKCRGCFFKNKVGSSASNSLKPSQIPSKHTFSKESASFSFNRSRSSKILVVEEEEEIIENLGRSFISSFEEDQESFSSSPFGFISKIAQEVLVPEEQEEKVSEDSSLNRSLILPFKEDLERDSQIELSGDFQRVLILDEEETVHQTFPTLNASSDSFLDSKTTSQKLISSRVDEIEIAKSPSRKSPSISIKTHSQQDLEPRNDLIHFKKPPLEDLKLLKIELETVFLNSFKKNIRNNSILRLVFPTDFLLVKFIKSLTFSLKAEDLPFENVHSFKSMIIENLKSQLKSFSYLFFSSVESAFLETLKEPVVLTSLIPITLATAIYLDVSNKPILKALKSLEIEFRSAFFGTGLLQEPKKSRSIDPLNFIEYSLFEIFSSQETPPSFEELKELLINKYLELTVKYHSVPLYKEKLEESIEFAFSRSAVRNAFESFLVELDRFSKDSKSEISNFELIFKEICLQIFIREEANASHLHIENILNHLSNLLKKRSIKDLESLKMQLLDSLTVRRRSAFKGGADFPLAEKETLHPAVLKSIHETFKSPELLQAFKGQESL